MDELIQRMNARFRFTHFSWSENDPAKGSENHVKVKTSESCWRFPDRCAAEAALSAAVKRYDVVEAWSDLNDAEDEACKGWYGNFYGGGEVHVGKSDVWPAVFAACGLDPEVCIATYLQPIMPGDWKYPKIFASDVPGGGG